MTNSFSSETKQVISNARFIAERFRHNYISTMHILLGMVAFRPCTAIDILEMYMEVDIDDLGQVAERSLKPEFEDMEGKKIPFTPGTKRMMEIALDIMKDNNDSYVDTFHLIIGILTEGKSECATLLNNQGITLKKFQGAIARFRKEEYKDYEELESMKETPEEINKRIDQEERANNRRRSQTNKKTFLSQFSRNLNDMAKEGKLDNVIGRAEETERMVHILCRRRKSNPILTGSAGTGKTSVVDGLAQRIVSGDIPHKLKDKVIYVLDMGSLVAGTKYRGEFEKRLQGILAEVRKDPTIILFIDEIHTVIGAGSAEGTLDASNLIKPALSRGELQCIGATTTDEYRNYFEKDNALNRRFQPIHIDEPTKTETIEILKGLKKYYEEYHSVTYSNEALSMIVDLTARYVTDKFFPDKAIDAMDEIGAKISANLDTVEVTNISDELEKLNLALRRKTSKKDIKSIEREINKIQKEHKDTISRTVMDVTEEDIKNTMSLISGVPLENVASNSDDAHRYLNMASELKQYIINQDEAIDKISNVIKRSKAGIRDNDRPSVLMLIGPTGTGKTFLSKQLANFLFGDEDALVYLDCSEFSEAHDTSKLIGSPPGYVGYDDAPKLDKIRTNPYSVILLDECEKAHPDTWNIFLRIFEEGQIENSQGITINFKNCIILMTSNIGSKRFTEPPKIKIGLDRKEGADTSIEAIHKGIMGDVKKHFKPEFLNRIDDVVIFNKLEMADLLQIIRLEIQDLKGRLKKEKGISLIVSASALKRIAEIADIESKGASGARPLRRVIDREVESQLCDIVLARGDSLSKISVGYNTTEGFSFKCTEKK